MEKTTPYLQILQNLFGFRSVKITLSFLLTCLWLVQGPSVAAAIDLSDIPVFTRIVPPPANIMLVLDDSGSMNFDILVREGYDGSFPNPANSPWQERAHTPEQDKDKSSGKATHHKLHDLAEDN